MKKKFKKKLLFYVILLLITFCISHFVNADTFSPSSQKNALVALLSDGEYYWTSSDLYTTLSYSNSNKTWYPQGLYYEFVIPSVNVQNTYTSSYTLRITYDYPWGSSDDGNFSYYSLYKNILNKKYNYGIYYNDNLSDYSCNLTNYSSSSYYEQYDFTCIYSFLNTVSNQRLFVGINGGGSGSVPFGSNVDIDIWNISNTYTTDKTNVIIDQNTTIINQNNETNTKIDKVNESINSEHDDFSNKSCGLICKLKKLPEQLFNKIKSLFVPDNFDFLNDFKETLENKLGFIASVPLQLLDYLISLKDKVFSPVSTIKFPKISIFGYYFWDEYTINTNDGLSWISSFKYLTDIACVILCCNTLRKWYSNFTGGEEK